MDLILASASSSRLRILRAAGIEPIVDPSEIDEDVTADSVAALVFELARAKARAVAGRWTDGLVLGCDSMLEVDGRIIGKPDGPDDAIATWSHTRGRSGLLHTGHCLIDVGAGLEASEVVATTVHFGRPSDAEVVAYVATGEPLSSAGSFTMEGRSAPFIDGVEGDPGNVLGLSMPALARLMGSFGYSVTTLWTGPGD